MSHLSVLVVDDEPYLADAIADLLRVDGHEVVTALDASAALAHKPTVPFHLILSDLVLPGSTGEQIFAAVQERGDAPCWFVLMSSFPEAVVRKRAKGFHRYIPKPMSLEQLRRLAQDCMADGQIAQRLRAA